MGVFLPPSFFSLTSLFESSLSRVSVPQGSLPVLSLLLTDISYPDSVRHTYYRESNPLTPPGDQARLDLHRN